MAIKQVLACVDGSGGDQAVLYYALQLARRFPLHIDVLHVRFDLSRVPRRSWYARQLDHLFGIAEALERKAEEAATRANQHFEAWRSQNNIALIGEPTLVQDTSAVWREIKGYEREVIPLVGRLTDLIITARPMSGSSPSLALETAVFDTGRPVLMVSEHSSTDLFLRPIIAWNGSKEAAQATGCAIPLLREVRGPVEIITAVETKHQTKPGELLRYLNWHGIVGRQIVIDDPSRPVGENLLAQAKLKQASLIVMGAYTHAHYRQFILGGVTHYIMQHASVPVLMVH
jgi:hypothetical protein